MIKVIMALETARISTGPMANSDSHDRQESYGQT